MDKLQEAMTRVDKFLLEWTKMSHKGNGIYGLNSGDENREAELNYSDLKLIVSKLKAYADLPAKIEAHHANPNLNSKSYDYKCGFLDALQLFKNDINIPQAVDIKDNTTVLSDAMDSIYCLEKTLLAFIEESERQDILPFVKADFKKIRHAFLLQSELLESLKKCTAWMEQLRESGDSGFWDWDENCEYSKAIKLIEKMEKRK